MGMFWVGRNGTKLDRRGGWAGSRRAQRTLALFVPFRPIPHPGRSARSSAGHLVRPTRARPLLFALARKTNTCYNVLYGGLVNRNNEHNTHRQAGVEGDMGSIFDYRLSTEQAARLAGATVRMLDYWCSRGLITPTVPAQGKGSAREFGFVDMVRIKVLVRLRNAGVPLQRIRRALEQLREWDEPDPLTSGRLIVIGDRLFWAKSDSELVDILSQQRAMVQVVLLDLAEIARETEAKLLEVCAA